MPKTDQIQFHRESYLFGFLSNFAHYSFDLKGKRWPTTEHYFQAMKFEDEELQEEIRKADSPAKAKKIGRNPRNKLRSDWREIKDSIMEEAVYAKFTQNNDIKKKLLETGNKSLVEHTRNDRYWGDGGDGSGHNRLGEILMSVRNKIRELEGISDDFENQVSSDSEKKVIAHKPSNGSLKARRKRNIYLDADGNSIMEKSNEKKGNINLIGEDVTFSEKALTLAAKVVVHRNQFRRKWQPTEEDFDDEEEESEDDESYNSSRGNNSTLQDFFVQNIATEDEDMFQEGFEENPLDKAKELISFVEKMNFEQSDLPQILEDCQFFQQILSNQIENCEDDQISEIFTCIERLKEITCLYDS